MYPHAASDLLLPCLVINQFALAEHLTENPSSFRISVYDVVEEHATVLGITPLPRRNLVYSCSGAYSMRRVPLLARSLAISFQNRVDERKGRSQLRALPFPLLPLRRRGAGQGLAHRPPMYSQSPRYRADRPGAMCVLPPNLLVYPLANCAQTVPRFSPSRHHTRKNLCFFRLTFDSSLRRYADSFEWEAICILGPLVAHRQMLKRAWIGHWISPAYWRLEIRTEMAFFCV